MIHRTVPLIGLTALTILVGMMAPAPAQAQLHPDLSEACKLILNGKPISTHYTARTLNRIDRGLRYIRQAQQQSGFEQYIPAWARSIASDVLGTVDLNVRITKNREDLPTHTACLRLDQLMLECKMEEVRMELNTQLKNQAFVAIIQLQSLREFTNERYSHLLKGASDPSYTDPTWGNRQLFDPPAEVWCCPQSTPGNICVQQAESECRQDNGQGGGEAFETLSQCAAYGCNLPDGVDLENLSDEEREDTLALCPFHSDYAPAFSNGYGCDVDVLQQRTGVLQEIDEQLSALRSIDAAADEYKDALQPLLDSLEEFRENGDQSEEEQEEEDRGHLAAYGCTEILGRCRIQRDKPCEADRDCRVCNGISCSTFDTCIEPEKLCTKNTFKTCTSDGNCGVNASSGFIDEGRCIEAEDTTLASRELRGAFSAEKEQIDILSSFLGERVIEGASREFVDELKVPTEFPPEKEQARKEREVESPANNFTRLSAREFFRARSAEQGAGEAGIFAVTADAALEINRALGPLRRSVTDFVFLANQRKGLRDFVVKFGYFLRRTCVARPCNLALEQALRIAQTDECFPYAKGEHLSDSTENPRWKKCAEAACIPLDEYAEDIENKGDFELDEEKCKFLEVDK